MVEIVENNNDINNGEERKEVPKSNELNITRDE